MGSKPALAVLVLACLLPGKALAQPAMDADAWLPASAPSDGLFVFAAPAGGGWLSAGFGWCKDLLRTEGGPAPRVEQRLRAELSAGASLADNVNLEVQTAFVPWQSGSRTDSVGIARGLEAGFADTWIGVRASGKWHGGTKLGVLAGLRLPSSSQEALAGDPGWGSRIGATFEYESGWQRLALSAILVARTRTRFRQLFWDDGLFFGAALWLGPPGWPARPFLEFAAELPAHRPASAGTRLQVAGGAALDFGRLRLLVGGGRAIHGLLTPSWRIMARASLTLEPSGGDNSADE
ncbi:MAG: hypothetical protein D6806_01110 [Deltaproteobacteria bacterium]|nr:MAG: hypothetical protein D6806_01110 [Deltaproteobacteria bacterium]